MKFFIFYFILFQASAYSSETSLPGNVSNITSIREGLLIILDTGKPSGCTQGTGWMLIKQENTTMISVALASYMAGNKAATIYVAPGPGSYCEITQFDPS
ncbi:MAG: hypothetical protein RPS47_12030 [Colwellia sp.]